ncbi:Uncharacterised protein [Vibrio cholerae]|uniref:Uncharacterized protein n=1 Tax=Vibrio cholerae TaxID=666 RepID=A0A656AX01_VIBCL|nr:Uncharacterised protein [Vibrio cholerae]CSD47503.1 Uncharacterised protein [Vibrio cholerae]CSD62701.1 Uncharacterised protein [Vibrio cholerae]CSD67794.1 Uncharacterised protein [Vibrio cholerae]CSD69296.1 Uncharacterised protein [Vibrio cholerae]
MTRNGYAIDHIHKLYATCHFSDDWHGMRFPVRYGFARSHCITIGFAQHRAVWQFVFLFGTTKFVNDGQLRSTRGDNELAIFIGYELRIVQFHRTVVLSLDAVFCCCC